MIWIIIGVSVIGFIFFYLFNNYNKEKEYPQYESLDKKFIVIINTINKEYFHGRGNITVHNKQEFNLHEQGKSQNINFQYNSGDLSITWKGEYFQKEIVHRKQFKNVKNINQFEQKRYAEEMISDISIIIENHKSNTNRGIG